MPRGAIIYPMMKLSKINYQGGELGEFPVSGQPHHLTKELQDQFQEKESTILYSGRTKSSLRISQKEKNAPNHSLKSILPLWVDPSMGA